MRFDVFGNVNAKIQTARRNSVSNACGDDEVTRYLEFVDTERMETLTDTEYADASNRKQCWDYCDDEGVISCASAMFSSAGCELSLSRANYSASDSFKESSNVTYVEKICVPKNFAKGQSSRAPNFHFQALRKSSVPYSTTFSWVKSQRLRMRNPFKNASFLV